MAVCASPSGKHRRHSGIFRDLFQNQAPPCTACVFNSPRENPRQFPHLIKWSGQPYPPGHMALIVVKQALAIAVEVLQMKIDTMFVGFVQHKP